MGKVYLTKSGGGGASAEMWAAIENKMEMTLLWENASPTSEFPAQTIPVNLTDYEHVGIEFTASAWSESGEQPIRIVRKSAALKYMGEHLNGESGNVSREITTMTDTGISFGTGYHNTYSDNTWMIPTRIYGVKGVE